ICFSLPQKKCMECAAMKKPAQIRCCLFIAGVLAFFPALVAFAQSPTAPAASDNTAQAPAPPTANQTGATAEAERVIVTGSNIPTAEEVGPNPVLTINRGMAGAPVKRRSRNMTAAHACAQSTRVNSLVLLRER